MSVFDIQEQKARVEEIMARTKLWDALRLLAEQAALAIEKELRREGH
jgi:hypothetical protein